MPISFQFHPAAKNLHPNVFVVAHCLPLCVHYENDTPLLIPGPEENDSMIASLYRLRKDLAADYRVYFVGSPKVRVFPILSDLESRPPEFGIRNLPDAARRSLFQIMNLLRGPVGAEARPYYSMNSARRCTARARRSRS